MSNLAAAKRKEQTKHLDNIRPLPTPLNIRHRFTHFEVKQTSSLDSCPIDSAHEPYRLHLSSRTQHHLHQQVHTTVSQTPMLLMLGRVRRCHTMIRVLFLRRRPISCAIQYLHLLTPCGPWALQPDRLFMQVKAGREMGIPISD